MHTVIPLQPHCVSTQIGGITVGYKPLILSPSSSKTNYTGVIHPTAIPLKAPQKPYLYFTGTGGKLKKKNKTPQLYCKFSTLQVSAFVHLYLTVLLSQVKYKACIGITVDWRGCVLDTLVKYTAVQFLTEKYTDIWYSKQKN